VGSTTAQAVANLLAKEGWFAEDRAAPSVASRLQAALASEATRLDVRTILERYVAVTASKLNCCLFAYAVGTVYDHVAAAFAEDVLQEYWTHAHVQHGTSQAAVAGTGTSPDSDAATTNLLARGQPSIVSWGDFSRAFRLVLRTTGMVTARSPQNTAGAFEAECTRESSTKFEAWWIENLLIPQHDKVVTEGNRAGRAPWSGGSRFVILGLAS
jgi:hypothetical protein